MTPLIFLFYIVFGLLPSLIWLRIYLREDIHPEPNRLILKVFILGMLITIPAALLESVTQSFLQKFDISPNLYLFLYCFLVIAVVEEISKYEVVSFGIFKNPEFNEPVDAMIYMITAALGFSAVENTLTLFSFGNSSLLVGTTLFIVAIRFLGATFIHTICSGTVGYFLGLSHFKEKNSKMIIILGLIIAVLLHGFYDYSIMTLVSKQIFIYLSIILSGLFFFIISEFRAVKRIKEK